MSSQSHVPYCKVLPPGEFNVMVAEPRVTLHAGRCHLRIQWHVIPESRVTLQGVATWWTYWHDRRATCHISGCCHLVNSMSLCHGHMWNLSSPYCIFPKAVWASASMQRLNICIVSDTLVISYFGFRFTILRTIKFCSLLFGVTSSFLS